MIIDISYLPMVVLISSSLLFMCWYGKRIGFKEGYEKGLQSNSSGMGKVE